MSPDLSALQRAMRLSEQLAPAMRQAQLSADLERLAPAIGQVRAMTSSFAPLAEKLAEAGRSLERVEAKRRRVVCKLGRKAANRAEVMAALERLSLSTVEELLDAQLSGAPVPRHLAESFLAVRLLRTTPEHLEATVCRQRAERFEARGFPPRRARRQLGERRAASARVLCRPVGSLAPPLGAHPTPDRCNPPRGAPVT